MASLHRFRSVALMLLGLLTAAATGCDRAATEDMVRLQGAGASFPAPLYFHWIRSFHEAHPNVQIDYQSVGSGSGVKSVVDGTVDFGASDAAMTPNEMERVSRGVQLLPITAGSIVLTYNLEGVPALKLSREAYAGIFLGTIKRWNDAAIAATNPGVALPDKPIHVIVRADSSGTTYMFTKHMSAVSPAFANSPGANKMPNWPVGTRSKGNEGVTASVKTSPGSIGYIEYGYAVSQKLPMAALENRAGAFVAPTPASGQAALADTELPASMIGWNPDPAVPDAYPIVTYTWLILYREYEDPKKLDALREFVRFGATRGQEVAAQLGYIALPPQVAARVVAAINENIKLVARR